MLCGVVISLKASVVMELLDLEEEGSAEEPGSGFLGSAVCNFEKVSHGTSERNWHRVQQVNAEADRD